MSSTFLPDATELKHQLNNANRKVREAKGRLQAHQDNPHSQSASEGHRLNQELETAVERRKMIRAKMNKPPPPPSTALRIPCPPTTSKVSDQVLSSGHQDDSQEGPCLQSSQDCPSASKRRKISESDRSPIPRAGRLSRIARICEDVAFLETHGGGQDLRLFTIPKARLEGSNNSTIDVYMQQITEFQGVCKDMNLTKDRADTVVGFHNSVDEMLASWKRGERKPLEVIRKHEEGKTTEEALCEIGQTMETTHSWDTGCGKTTRPTLSIRNAFADPGRLKCLSVKNLPTSTETLAEKLSYHDLSFRIQAGFQQANASWDPDQHEFTLRANINGLIPTQKKPQYKASKTLDADTLNQRFRIASTWAILNATNSLTDWHIDAAGSSTHFIVKSGQKAWMVNVDGVKAGVILKSGDAAYMAPNVQHCVFTPEQSVCVGGHGWHLSELPMAQAALRREATLGSNETIPLWYPAMVQFGLELTQGSSESIKQKHNLDDAKLHQFRLIVQECLETDYLQHSSPPPKDSSFVKNTLADFGWKDIFEILKFCERPAAVASYRLAKALMPTQQA